MPSKLGDVVSNVVTVVGAVSGIKACVSSPLSAAGWLEASKNGGARHNSAHVGLRDSPEITSGDTACEVAENLPVRITVIQPNLDLDWVDLATLRDAVVDGVFKNSNLTQGGYAETTDLAGFEIEEDAAEYAVWYIDLDILTIWTRAS